MRIAVFIAFTLLAFVTKAQENIPLGTWRTHFSFNSITEVLEAGDRIYAVGENGLFFIDRSDNSITTIGKIDGLQEDNISALEYDANNSQLIIGYTSGNVDVVVGNEIISLDLVSNSQVLGSKRINHITAVDNQAFISTDYGLLNMDLNKIEIQETYRQLGEDAAEIVVNQALINNDSIFLATEVGVIASNFKNNTNLSDPFNWKRFDQSSGIPKESFQFLVQFNNQIHAFNNAGVYAQISSQWSMIPQLSNIPYTSVEAANDIILAISEGEVQLIDQDYEVTAFSNSLVTDPADAIVVDQLFYIADVNNGLLAGTQQSLESIKPSGPNTNLIYQFVSDNGVLYSLPGGFDQSRTPLFNNSGFNTFQNGRWSSSKEQGLSTAFVDVTDAAFDLQTSTSYFATFGSGLLAIDRSGEIMTFDASNSTLREVSQQDTSIYISSLTFSQEGLWVINYGSPVALHLFAANDWQPFPLPTSSILDIKDSGNYLWMIVDRASGGGILVFEKSTGATRYLTEQSGNGGLPSNSVFSLDIDLDGQVWIGTGSGVAVISSFVNIIDGAVDAMLPIFENRFLLRDEVITAMKVDPGNRKWIGTENGVWLFDESADIQLQNFTISNSPLPSNQILAIGITENSGEVFFGTSSGIVSYRSDATIATEVHNDVKIFPNPVTADYQGTVGIAGLANNVNVKITDANGQLIWNTESAGGTATWNALDYNGRRAATGVYFVFSSTEDGNETFIGKILVVN